MLTAVKDWEGYIDIAYKNVGKEPISCISIKLIDEYRTFDRFEAYSMLPTGELPSYYDCLNTWLYHTGRKEYLFLSDKVPSGYAGDFRDFVHVLQPDEVKYIHASIAIKPNGILGGRTLKIQYMYKVGAEWYSI